MFLFVLVSYFLAFKALCSYMVCSYKKNV